MGALSDQITKEWRKTAAWKEIEEEAARSFKFQRQCSVMLEGMFPQFPFKYPDKRWMDGKKPFDLLIRPAFKIELEGGLRSLYWTDHIPFKDWHRGLSVLTRKLVKCKDGSTRWDLFIKFSRTRESFFAVTYEYLLKIGVFDRLFRNPLKYSTNNDYLCVPLDKVLNDDQNMCYDDFGLLEKLITNQLKVKNARLL